MSDPFATPARTSSNFDADEIDTTAIGVALTADVRRSLTPGVVRRQNHLEGSIESADEHGRSVRSSSPVAGHVADIVTAPARTQRPPRQGRSRITGTWQGLDDSSLGSVDRTSSIDSVRSGRRNAGRAATTVTPTRRRARRPPVSLRRHFDVSGTDTDEEPTITRRNQSYHPRNRRQRGTVFTDARWPASTNAQYPVLPENGRLGTPTRTSTDAIDWASGSHSDARPSSATSAGSSEHSHAGQGSSAVSHSSLAPTEGYHLILGRHARRHSHSFSAGSSITSTTISNTHSNANSNTTHTTAESSWRSDAAQGHSAPSETSETPRKKKAKVAFAEPDRTESGHLRRHSESSGTTISESQDLQRPDGALLRNPFDHSFAESLKENSEDEQHGSTTSRRTSAGRRPSSERVGFLRRVSRRFSTAAGPLDIAHRTSSVSDGSQPSTRRPSLAGPQRNGSTASAHAGRPPAHGRSKSMWDRRVSFRDPFRRHSQDDVESRLTGGRRASAPNLARRPSTFRRMSSVVVPENPIPRRYRTRSVSSFAYYVTPIEKNNATIPIFGDDIEAEKENVEEFLAAVEVLQARFVRKPWQTKMFKVLYFLAILCIIYFVFVGQPLWDGVALIFYRWVNSEGLAKVGSALFMSWAAFQAFIPMLGARFEQEVDDVEKRDASEVALVIPAYKAAKILPETIKHALKIFKPEQIFIMANGNSETPLDDTAEVCKEFGVNVAWVPIGSKITAEFCGVALTSKYKYILLIDDDVHLPPNLPIVTDRIQGMTKCIGYTIKSTGENGSKGTLIQQCQDMEYKLSGLTRTFCGKWGSATFPHGAIILWDRATLQSLFNVHPGYAISEDWFFGYAARASGHRIQFCSQVFVETETPPSLFFTNGPARGGFGEMTVFKQRFFRWNFFWSHRLWEDTVYILCSWRLGWYEIITKIWVLVELYDCVMSFLRPWIIVLALIANYKLLLIFMAALTAMYALAFILFNSWHLRRKKEMIAWKVMPVYMGMKFMLMWVNVVSVYWDMYCYAKYFSVKHPRVIESRSILEAAYKARLGSNLVPLDAKLGDATAAAMTKTESALASGDGPLDKVEAAPPLDGHSLVEAGQGIFSGFNKGFTFAPQAKKGNEKGDEKDV